MPQHTRIRLHADSADVYDWNTGVETTRMSGRAAARLALDVYIGLADRTADIDVALSDLIADLLHVADVIGTDEGFSPYDVLDRAQRHFESEPT